MLVVAVVAVFGQTDDDFDKWKNKFKKSYGIGNGTKTEAAAKATYKKNAAAIAKHNSNKTAKYKQAANMNADLTPDEVKKTRKGYKYDAQKAKQAADSMKGKVSGALKSSAAGVLDKKFPEPVSSQMVQKAIPAAYDLRPYVEQPPTISDF